MATVGELDSILSSAPAQITMVPEAATRSFRTFGELKAYFDEESQFWNTLQLPELYSVFNGFLNELRKAEQGNVNGARSLIIQVVNAASSPGRPDIIHSSTRAAKFLQDIARRDVGSARIALAYFKGTFTANPAGSSAGIDGMLAAALFRNPWMLSGDRAAELQAFATQRQEINTFREDTATRFTTLKQDADKWQAKIEEDATRLLGDKTTAFDTEHGRQLRAFQTSETDWKKKFTDLEKTYTEKLRLEKPAFYWGELEKKYVIQGRWWMAASTGVVISLVSWVTYVVYCPPQVLTGEKFTLSGVKGAILIAAAISGFAYLLSLLVRGATSSYHLARDARERFQLTHVFLALIKDNAIETQDREIILSALFSRSDTGLLKSDSSPTLPTPLGSIMETLLKIKRE